MRRNQSKSLAGFTRRTAVMGALAAMLTVARGADAQTIIDVGNLSGSDGAYPAGVNANGTVVAATSPGATGLRSFRWTQGRGLEELGALPGSNSTWAYGISGNGEVIAGFATLATGVDQAVRWTRGHGLESLGFSADSYAYATAASFTGNEITGVYASPSGLYHAYLWTPRGMRDLGTPPGGSYSYGYGISGNGNVVVGLGGDLDTNAVSWTARDGMRTLPPLAPGDWAMAAAADRDGSTIAGSSGSNAVIWRDGAVRDLGTIPGGTFSSTNAISADGRVVAGYCDNAAGAVVACIWTERLGFVQLDEHLASLGVDLTGWTISSVVGLSADGSALTGGGTHDGQSRVWLARVPSIDGRRGGVRGCPPHVHTHDSPSLRLRQHARGH